jgi:alanyl aminopeptidase
VREAVEIEVVPDRERFSGRVEISLELAAARSDLWVSSRGLQISESRLEVGGEVLAVGVETDDAVGATRVVFPRAVGPGAATLRLSFSGPFDPRLAGLYRVKVQDRWYAYTQFEAIDARRAFPCFDEPAFKIPWDLAVTLPAADIAVSNTPILDETPVASGLKRVRFKTTRPLPSYLVALAVGAFDVVVAPPIEPNEVRHRPLQLRGMATRGRGAELAFALQAGAEMLVMLERWFGMEFPYEKLDYIAVPDFQFGAMENAGAITFHDGAVLVNAAGSSERQKKWVAVVLAHEMAHQWFGDLVTMRWWDDLWLNESFATLLEREIVSAWNPALRYDLAFLEDVDRAMSTDELARAKPIRPKVVLEADIGGDSDIVYAKGASVLGMFEQFLGRDSFQAAVRSYLQSHADGNATLADLLSALSAKRPAVGPAMRSFVEQAGVPLVEGRVQCRSGKVLLELRQSRSRPIGSEAPAASWMVPVCARAEGVSGSTCTLSTGSSSLLELRRKGCPQWVALNPGAAGYYRWTLPAAQLQPLIARAGAVLGPAERLSLENNLIAAFDAGGMGAEDVLAGLGRFAADAEPAVSIVPASLLKRMRQYVVSPELRPRVEAHARQLYQPVLAGLGWESRPEESARVREFRGDLVTFLALSAGAEDVLARAARLGRSYLGEDGSLHPELVDVNLVGPALAAAGAVGDAQLFDRMVDRLEKSTDAEARQKLLGGLASFRDPVLAERARGLTFDPRLRSDERIWVLVRQLRTPETHADAWSWTRSHISELVRVLPADHVPYIIAAAAGCSPDDAAALEALGSALANSPGGRYSIEKAAETTRRCAALASAQRPGTDAFFQRAPAPVARE